MYIKVDGYEFPMIRIQNEWDITYQEFYIGNPKCKPKPCITISVYNNTDAILQNIIYFKNCNVTKKSFERGSGGMHILVKASLKWLFKEYPKLKKILFTDNSYYGEDISLPEKMVLTEGQTWYMKYFGAKPSGIKTKLILQQFLNIYNKDKSKFIKLQEPSWKNKNISETLKEYNGYLQNKRLMDSEWYISRETIETYDIDPFLINEQHGGENKLHTIINNIPRPKIRTIN